jgi:hypothetical protein
LSGGVVRKIPDSGWHVHYQRALTDWLASEPPATWITPTVEWLRGLESLGPPPDAKAIGEDLYLVRVPGTKVDARYLVIPFEYLILIKQLS